MNKQRRLWLSSWWRDVVGVGLLSIPLLVYSWRVLNRPSQTAIAQPLYQGVTYQRMLRRIPHPVLLHLVKLDLQAPGLRVVVTPPDPKFQNQATAALTTSQFVQATGVQLAVNASFFYPFREDAPWDYYPYRGDRTVPVGLTITNGKTLVPPKAEWPAICFAPNNQAQIVESGSCPPQTQQAVAGNALILKNGQIRRDSEASDRDRSYGRTIVALDKSGRHLWLLIADDKQPHYSEGITLNKAAQILAELGADTALNLDGGGSTTLVMRHQGQPKVLNAPIHTKLPMQERVVANHLGFFAQPLPPKSSQLP
ncbi:MAG TPA: phosphodiester glycosidase family protein [Leptolyngbyaceae cyanobacterium M33_DOE_097]|nr:phosphodiester glycosidase family protein [Leptolyngbyaceae cyanobacterium M33_DOE_097]